MIELEDQDFKAAIINPISVPNDIKDNGHNFEGNGKLKKTKAKQEFYRNSKDEKETIVNIKTEKHNEINNRLNMAESEGRQKRSKNLDYWNRKH